MEQFSLQPFGKILILFGTLILLLGIIFLFVDKIPFIGRLPGDIIIHKKIFTFYFPFTTLIILNLLILLIFLFLRK